MVWAYSFMLPFLFFFSVGFLRQRVALAVSTDVVASPYNTEIGCFWTELAAEKPIGVLERQKLRKIEASNTQKHAYLGLQTRKRRGRSQQRCGGLRRSPHYHKGGRG